MATETKFKVNDLATYHGSKPFFHGTIFRIVSSVCGHYDVAYATDPDGDVQLRDVRASSLTRIDAKAYWATFKTCRACGTEHGCAECPICN